MKLADKLQVEKAEDWYRVKIYDFYSNGGGDVIFHYDHSLPKALASLFPNEKWFLHFRSDTAGKGFWKNLSNQRSFLDQLGKRLMIHELEDWYQIHKQDIVDRGGTSLLTNYYGGNLCAMLRAVYSHFDWKEHKFGKSKEEIRVMDANRAVLEEVGRKIGVGTWEDWLSRRESDVSPEIVESYGSLTKALFGVFPEHDWKSKIQSIWSDGALLRARFDRLGRELGVVAMEDWYGKDLQAERELEVGLLSLFGNSVPSALKAVYPEFGWQLWRFQTPVPHNFWTSITVQREFLDWAGKELGFRKMEDWYGVKRSDLENLGGATLVKYHYNGSVIRALLAVYPEHEWVEWKFVKLPKGFWNSEDNTQSFLHWLEKELGIKRMEDWYSITYGHFQRFGAANLLHMSGGMLPLLERYYPDFRWDAAKLQFPSKGQGFLAHTLAEVFQGLEFRENFKHPMLRFASNRSMELDIFFPELKLAFEYQGEPHFLDTYYFQPADVLKVRDERKKKVCEENGITLIEVPYWWDLKKPSLLGTIHARRPDISERYFSRDQIGEPIPPTIPKAEGVNLKTSH